MHTRQSTLNKWLNDKLGNTFSLTALKGDASFRQYYRLFQNNLSYIVMDAPPKKESISSFIHISRILQEAGIHTPKIYAIDKAQGFVLMEDMDDLLFLDAIDADNLDTLYQKALTTLVQMQDCEVKDLKKFDHFTILNELGLFTDWFLHQYLKLTMTLEEKRLLHSTFHKLSQEIQNLPHTFVHRDFHSRNLMVIGQKSDPSLGVIDFQDAVCGPVTYDLVSLLKDCYIKLPKDKVENFVNFFYQMMPKTLSISFTDFMRGFELCGLQRHLKVLGVFSRLHIRDNKSNYLKDLPLTFMYILDVLAHYPELQAFYTFMRHKVHHKFSEVSISCAQR